MPGLIATIPKYQFSNSIGIPLVNGTLTVTLTNTTTPTPTWQDSAQTVLNTNPITLDSRGECVLWLDSAVTYRFVLKNSLGITQWTVDNIKGGDSYVYILEALLAASGGSAKIGFLQAGTGAVNRTAQSKMRDIVNVKDFGAVCDGATDDTAAVQLAINYCATGGLRWGKLIVPGRCLITSSLKIDRPADTELTEFIIEGSGIGAGFYVTTAINIFDSNIANVDGAPLSEFVTFKDIVFESSLAAAAAYVLTKKFLRIKFLSCVFQKIKCGNFVKGSDAKAYAQTFTFVSCNMRYWSGIFFNVFQFYNLKLSGNCVMEFGGSGFVTDGGGVFGVSIVGNLFEGSSGNFIKFDGGQCVAIFGNYTEGNTGVDYILTNVALGGQLLGCAFHGNFQALTVGNAANPAFWNVIIGDVRGMTSGGNYCSGKMFDNNATFADNVLSVGDYAVVNLQKTLSPIVVKPTRITATDVITAFAGGGQSSAIALTTTINRVGISTVTGIDSVKLPATSTVIAGVGLAVTVINDSAYAIQVFGTGTDSINFIASGTGISQASINTKTYYCAGPNGRWSV